MTLRPRDRFALIGLVLLALAGAYYLLALKPEQQKVKTLNASIATQQQAIVQAEQQIATGQAAVDSLRTDAMQWASVGLAIPAQADIPGLLRTLERTAGAEHVTMQSISLSGSPNATTQASAASSNSSASSVPIQLSFTGGFQALDALLQRLESLVTVSGGELHATGPLLNVSSVQLSGSSSLTAQVSATIYQLPASSADAGTATTPTAQ